MNLKQIRKSRGLTQDELAKALEMNHHSNITNYENGHREPGIKTIFKLCQILNCKFEELYPEFKEFNPISEKINDEEATIEQLLKTTDDTLNKLVNKILLRFKKSSKTYGEVINKITFLKNNMLYKELGLYSYIFKLLEKELEKEINSMEVGGKNE